MLEYASLKFPLLSEKYTFNVIITLNDPDGYLVTCPALPGLVTQGDTLEEAREMAADALTCHLESLIEDGLPDTRRPDVHHPSERQGCMTKLPQLKPRQVVRGLERAGFALRKSKGGHRTYVKAALRVTIPYHEQTSNQELYVPSLTRLG